MKNLVYIFADQWRKKGVGYEGAPVATPNMDAFAKESLVFDNAISTYPLCSPHRGALLTGRYPYTLGLWTNCKIGLDEHVMLKPKEITIGNVLKEAGYQTAYIGKWHLDASEMNFDEHPESGAVHWDAYTPPGERRQGFDYWLSYGAMDNHLNPHYWHNSSKKIMPNKWSPEYETDKAIEYMQNRNSDDPFCLFISWNPPHPPTKQTPSQYIHEINRNKMDINVPEEMKNDPQYKRMVEEYYGGIEGLDQNFGRIYDYLKNQDLLDDTIIVLSADHGEMLGSQGLLGKNIWYEESINIPLLIRDSRIVPGRTDMLFSSIDHMPTLLDLLNISIPETVHGRSMKELMVEGDVSQTKEAEYVFITMIPGMPNIIKAYREKGLNNKSFGWRGVRGKNFTYVINNGSHPDECQERFYYDLEKDPNQMNPMRLDKTDSRCVALDKVIEGYLKKTNDPFLMDCERRYGEIGAEI